MTDKKVIRYIDQMCVKDGDIKVKNIRKDGSYTLIIPVINGAEEFNQKQIATLEMESYFDGEEFVLLNFPKTLLSDDDYIAITTSLEAALLYNSSKHFSLDSQIQSASIRASDASDSLSTGKPHENGFFDL